MLIPNAYLLLKIFNENICIKFECMKKKLTLWIFLLPLFLAAQDATYKNGTITFDFNKKKSKQQDTVQQQSPYSSDNDDEDSVKNKRSRIVRPPKEVTTEG